MIGNKTVKIVLLLMVAIGMIYFVAGGVQFTLDPIIVAITAVAAIVLILAAKKWTGEA